MPCSPGAPRQRRKAPSYRRHSTGQAFVEIRGRRYYLGQHGTDQSWAAYKAKLDELWLKPPPTPPADKGLSPAKVDRLSVIDLLFAYRPYAENHYRRHGEPTGTFANMGPAMRRFRELYGQTLAREFGPLKFQALRQTWIDERKAVKTVNEYAAAVRRVFRWGVKNELVPPAVFEGLRSVEGLAIRTGIRVPRSIVYHARNLFPCLRSAMMWQACTEYARSTPKCIRLDQIPGNHRIA